MSDPRIGDTVHYALGSAVCRAALVTEPGPTPTLRIYDTYSASDDYAVTSIAYDTDGAVVDVDGNTSAGPNGFTPGTWHRIH